MATNRNPNETPIRDDVFRHREHPATLRILSADEEWVRYELEAFGHPTVSRKIPPWVWMDRAGDWIIVERGDEGR